MHPVKDLRLRARLTQARLAHLAGTSQPTIAAYESGAKSPNLKTLKGLASAAGFQIAIDFVPPLTREDRRSLALHRAIIEKLTTEPERVLRLARKTLKLMLRLHPHASPLLNEWRILLDLPVTYLADILRDPGPHKRELRQVSPFAGILTAGERTEVYREFARSEERRT